MYFLTSIGTTQKHCYYSWVNKVYQTMCLLNAKRVKQIPNDVTKILSHVGKAHNQGIYTKHAEMLCTLQRCDILE